MDIIEKRNFKHKELADKLISLKFDRVYDYEITEKDVNQKIKIPINDNKEVTITKSQELYYDNAGEKRTTIHLDLPKCEIPNYICEMLFFYNEHDEFQSVKMNTIHNDSITFTNNNIFEITRKESSRPPFKNITATTVKNNNKKFIKFQATSYESITKEYIAFNDCIYYIPNNYSQEDMESLLNLNNEEFLNIDIRNDNLIIPIKLIKKKLETTLATGKISTNYYLKEHKDFMELAYMVNAYNFYINSLNSYEIYQELMDKIESIINKKIFEDNQKILERTL